MFSFEKTVKVLTFNVLPIYFSLSFLVLKQKDPNDRKMLSLQTDKFRKSCCLQPHANN